ncbi:MAG: GNAT family N-acetyltransferase [Chloroflexota bacterium]
MGMYSEKKEEDGKVVDLINGEKVFLRQLMRSDLDEMDHWPSYKEPDLQWANFSLRSAAQKQAWYRQEAYDPTRKRFGVFLKGRLIGVLGFRSIDYRRRRATLGIHLSAGEVDRGYGTDAIRAALTYAFGKMDLNEVNLDVAEDNLRARRCYEKCGFRLIGRHRDYRGQGFLDMKIRAEEFTQQSRASLSS